MAATTTTRPMPELKEGDWICGSCHNHNFSSRSVCNRCSSPKPPPTGEGVRSGDWMCPSCGNHNYAKRNECNRCRVGKPGSIPAAAGDYMSQMIPPMGYSPYGGPVAPAAFGASGYEQIASPVAVSASPNFRPGDWSCGQCGNHNYASRAFCNKCQGPKPGAASFGGSYGPAGGRGGGGGYARAMPYMQMPPGLAGNMRPGDWVCPGCANHNYASREACNKCKRSKNTPPNFRDGDWMCPKCNNHNFASKAVCNKCQEPKA